ncbi:PQQ-like beta-propeller repeat protein [Palleronia pelagia]|uniref:Outer membrane protein assembly factor BamB, contains PQQ-like beta-propeller repeat n=1 Tax=Palleronia pelagia TaxID=387096 RepID=A0A1H8B9S6_9RHOB|nr:PQQ-like beta-propeller repeat protein [Palleronia pelagia]SEM79456.1 Outer membrane protein assembly factor BamB, contains PQQ-like beta-propeller repeat [Palleronia pelagia]
MTRKTRALLGICAAALMACGEQETILTGERLSLRALDGAEQTVDQSRPISLPPMQTLADWGHRAANARHAIPHATLSAQPQLIFSSAIGQGDSRKHRISADPVVGGGRIYTVDSRARVMAHAPNGAALWSADVTPAGEPSDDASGAGLAYANGRLYVSTGFGQVHALDAATGRTYWTQDLGASAAGAPTVVGGRVYVVARDATGWALDAATGRVDWTEQGSPSDAGVVGGAAPAVSGDTIVMPFASRELVGLLPGGTRTWVSDVAGTRLGRVYATITDITGDPVIVGDTVYAGSPSGRTNAVDLASGEVIWSAEDGAMSPALVAGGSVFTVSDQSELVRLDAATGDRIWATPMPFFQRNAPKKRQGIYAHYGPILAGGRLWVASGDNLLRAFSPETGALAAQVPLPGGAATNPVVANGTLYVVSSNGRLLAFR